ncbi:hypothetical protein CVT25_015701 [Psilocybe cyanescens]|uniref:ATP-dependent DNA helicase n=1 Tax=Psilocybe cyanescens TaxID=93625 RepID=A0A409XPU0_PSICY|nr:hypothetical protein CVT25_015701 [Psilocybe cyanescens]
MKAYIKNVIQADIGGKTKEQVLEIPKVAGISYSRPVDPRTATDEELLDRLAKLVRALQYHKCTPAACLKLVKGRLECKRRAPFHKAIDDWVDEVGNWGPKRVCELLNSFNPSIMQALRANHDLKLIMSGKDTATITFYITNYATKKQQRSSNVSALLATTLAFSRAVDRRQTDMNLVNKRLIQRCANSLTRYREFSAPEVMSYIMGWGDIYESHHFVSIFWDAAARSLQTIFPELDRPSRGVISSRDGADQTHGSPTSLETLMPAQGSSTVLMTQREHVPDPGQESNVTINMVGGKVVLRDQLKDYKFRGEELREMNFLKFMLNTYEGDIVKKKKKKTKTPNANAATDANTAATVADAVVGVDAAIVGVDVAAVDGNFDIDNPDFENEDEEEGEGEEGDEGGATPIRRGRGRPLSERVKYKEGAGKPTRCRIVRGDGHETMPRFVGRWFPRNDGTEEHEKEFYYASILALLSPWSELSELKGDFSTFKGKFDRMLEQGDREVLKIIHNIQYYYECLDGAHARREEEKTAREGGPLEFELEISEEDRAEMDELVRANVIEDKMTEEDLEIARLEKIAARDTMFGTAALYEGYCAGVFDDSPMETVWNAGRKLASGDDTLKIAAWEKKLKETVRRTVSTEPQADTVNGSVQNRAPNLSTANTAPEILPIEPSRVLTDSGVPVPRQERMLLALLNEEQRRAHDIVERRLQQHMTNGKAPQLRMLILGQGGTGKSMLIGAITETFRYYGQLDILAKCATTGIAATDIGGMTLHSWAGLSQRPPTKEDWLEGACDKTLNKWQRNIEGKAFLILDEVSMTDKTGVFLTSEVTGHTRANDFKGSAEDPFGGMHLIFTGDFHQFPPVGNATGALYVEKQKDTARATIRREIFKQFDTVVILDKQIRIKDKVWIDILNRLRMGECDYNDIEEVEKLVLEHKECDKPNFQEAPWSDAVLVTSRHVVREMWNVESLAKHCRTTGNIRYIVEAEDTVKKTGERPSISTRCKIAKLNEDHTQKLAETVQIAVGMKAMILLNIATEGNIANGTRGIIHDIILDEREWTHPPITDGTAKLKYPPAMILFKPNKRTELQFDGIEPGLIPLTPSEATFSVKTKGKKKKSMLIKRRQYGITAGYAFTDYKSQGQTIEYVIIDLAKPPTGSLSPFGVYVAMSRSRGRDTIRLLRPFDRKLFQHHPSEDLRKDMKRLEEINERTRDAWELDRNLRGQGLR